MLQWKTEGFKSVFTSSLSSCTEINEYHHSTLHIWIKWHPLKMQHWLDSALQLACPLHCSSIQMWTLCSCSGWKQDKVSVSIQTSLHADYHHVHMASGSHLSALAELLPAALSNKERLLQRWHLLAAGLQHRTTWPESNLHINLKTRAGSGASKRSVLFPTVTEGVLGKKISDSAEYLRQRGPKVM